MTTLTTAVLCLALGTQSQGPTSKQFEETVWQRQPVALVNGPPEALINVNMVEAELASILQTITSKYNANLVLLSGQNRTLTLRLTNVTLAEFVRHVCAITGLRHLKIGTTYVIAEDDMLKSGYPSDYALANPGPPVVVEQPLVTDFYMTNFVDSQQIVSALNSMLGESVTVVAGPAQSAPAISQQDTTSVTGVASGVLRSDTASGQSVGRLLMIRGTQVAVEAALALAKRLDYERPQVEILVTIHDIANDSLRELGLSWTFSDVAITESGNQGIGFGSFARSPMSFLAVISALEKVDRAKLLASPNISVLDGERAYVLIGSRLNFPVLIGYTSANTPIFDRQEERVGIYLQVAPSITSDNRITLSIYPQVSTITGFLNVGGASYPQIATREAQTTLRVQNGETIVMAGMLRDEEVRALERIPVLSDIPILGELFTRRKRTRTSSQVIITITPTIIQSEDSNTRRAGGPGAGK